MYWLVCIWYSAPLVNDVPLALFKWSFLGKLLKRHAWSVWYVDLEKRFRFCPGPDYLRIFLIEFSQPIGEGIPCSCRQKKKQIFEEIQYVEKLSIYKRQPPPAPQPKKTSPDTVKIIGALHSGSDRPNQTQIFDIMSFWWNLFTVQIL